MNGYLFLLPVLLAVWSTVGVWIVFGMAVANKAVNISQTFPYISVCGADPPQSCVFSQVLNIGAAMGASICILRYYQLQDWGLKKRSNQVILCSGLLCALGTSIVGNFQHQHQLATHLTGAFLAFFVGAFYFWLQLGFLRGLKMAAQPGAPWLGPLRLGLCSICSVLSVAMVVLHIQGLRSVAAYCEWTVAMILFLLFGLLAVDFSCLSNCTLQLKSAPLSSSPPVPAGSLQLQQSQAL
ncbi:modulator of macroautophagy TMEM150B [Sorex fumeus]|uniref:modulator of macroautophagy TMEM150B n=1 Tax=Sorex fumeus TaxID=62283 RepID=UPI0024AD2A91|nr:modulator of macroautophagy TMEM150B [Sorex fumeus]